MLRSMAKMQQSWFAVLFSPQYLIMSIEIFPSIQNDTTIQVEGQGFTRNLPCSIWRKFTHFLNGSVQLNFKWICLKLVTMGTYFIVKIKIHNFSSKIHSTRGCHVIFMILLYCICYCISVIIVNTIILLSQAPVID